ncbi:iron dicitrate transport regulator FecR [Methylomonas sp. LWB]|uniref:FecR family protein n=1 Tax=Methylomonas sp. LWB TaxID=1905845 RepID=UPI0008D94DDE|nr:FecR domain-containing protein [Methylomonas sp. LWB]OHX37179.1 iron dicitrate transport regulator FecR [Methylomonas sp. LWB]
MSLASLTESQRQALQWLSRLRGDADETERRQFEDWLGGSPEHAEAYQQVQQFWQQLGDLPDVAGKQLDAARGFVRHSQLARRRRNAALIAVGFAVALGFQYPEPLQKLAAARYQTDIGQRRTLALADGGRIELNTATRLRIDRFGARTVWLEQGEAWFSVAHDAEHPFEVRVGAGRIRDVGTQFNVEIDRENTTVAVVEGEVALSVPGKPALALTAGLQAGFSADGNLRAPSVADAASGAWRDGTLIFKRQPLPEVLRQLSRYHAVQFKLTDSQLQTVTVSGRFSTSDLNESLSTLQNGLAARIVREGDGTILISAKQ